jgi:hypothetical protein
MKERIHFIQNKIFSNLSNLKLCSLLQHQLALLEQQKEQLSGLQQLSHCHSLDDCPGCEEH